MENSTVEPGGGSCARWFLGMGGGGVPSKIFFLKKRLLGFTTDPLGRRKQIFGNLFPFGNVPCKIQLVPKTASNDLCQNRFPRRADENHICPREKHGCAVKFLSAKVSKMSCHEYKGYKWQYPTTQSPTQQHNEP